MFAQLSDNPSFADKLTGFAGFGPVITVGNITQVCCSGYAYSRYESCLINCVYLRSGSSN